MAVWYLKQLLRRLSLLAVGLMLPAAGHADDQKEKPMFTSAGHTTDDLATVKSRVEQQQAMLLDVREQDEWDAGHLKSARLVPLSAIKSGQIPEQYQKLLPKDRPIYLHCRSGGRVLPCGEVLKAHGYDVRPLKAGYEKLVEFGFETAVPAASGK